jgi:carbonic anhydrase
MCNDPSHRLCFSRRMIVTGAAAFAATTWSTAKIFAQEAGQPQNAISPDAALKRLMDGNARYVANTPTVRDFSAGRAARARAQYPVAAVLSCADSRVAPEFAFDQGAGDLFVVRLAGNFANDDGIASLEYAVQFLKVPLILVVGHTGCGAVEAAIKVWQNNDSLPGHLPDLVAAIRPAVAIAAASGRENLLENAIAENVRQTMTRLGNSVPVLSNAVSSGKVKIAGGVYDLATGKVNLVDRSQAG